MMHLSRFSDIMAKCSSCAFCQATCPVFQADLTETHMPRARMQIIRGSLLRDELPVSGRVREVVDRCLMCGNCHRTCPAGVPIDSIVACARHALHPGGSVNPLVRPFFRSFLENRGHTALAAAALRMGRFAYPKGLPLPAAEPFLKTHRGVFPARGETRAKVAYFVGCATNSFYPDTALAALRALTENGVEVTVVPDLSCCGMPTLAGGDLALAESLAKKNIAALAALSADAIVTDCTTCGLVFKKKIPELLAEENDDWKQKAQAVSAKVFEATEYLMNLGLVKAPAPRPVRATYHVPCHRSWSPGLDDAPRRALARVPELFLAEMDRPDACCGAGGAYFTRDPVLSEKIREPKIADIENLSVSMIVTQCPMCRSYLAQAFPEKSVVHPVSLLCPADAV
ncbi:MAG: (Fe-S)-binding protein [Thermodesulfobacteriota bacterium]